jgi:MFS family permease
MDSSTVLRKLRSTFPALTHRNFRLFFVGQCVSLIGTWMQNIGQAWLVLQLTSGQADAPFKLGLVSALQFLPMMLFSLFAGTLVDRFPKRTVLIVTQSSLAVATITALGVARYWHVLVLALLLGVVQTLDLPTRQSFFVELVGKEDLMNAIGLNSTLFNLARILGPAVAGLLISLVGIAACFYLNAASFLAVIAGLALMRIPRSMEPRPVVRTFGTVLLDIREGLVYVRHTPAILYPLLLLAILSTFVINFNVLVPIFATQNLGQEAAGYGLLMTSLGLGSFLGALRITTKSKSGARFSVLFGGAAGMCILLPILGLERSYPLACATLIGIGFCTISFTTLVNTKIQLTTEDRMRGRVMSLFSLVFGGVIPFGSLYAGKLTEVAGATGCMLVSGVLGLAGTLFIYWRLRRALRPELEPLARSNP